MSFSIETYQPAEIDKMNKWQLFQTHEITNIIK